jgi:hypothetical protein
MDDSFSTDMEIQNIDGILVKLKAWSLKILFALMWFPFTLLFLTYLKL